jgi:hypothetical protein
LPGATVSGLLNLSGDSEFVPTRNAFTDQVAGSTAVKVLAIPVELFPASLNLCTTVPVHRSWLIRSSHRLFFVT